MNYWLSEKMNGCHVYWTGFRLLSRGRNEINCPSWLIKDLPAEPFEAEIYAGIGTLNRVQGLVRRRRFRDLADWQGVRLHLFDLPARWALPFGEVVQAMNALDLPEHCTVIPQRLTTSADDVRREFNAVVARGGEGLCLRETGGSYHLAKLRPNTIEERLTRCFLEPIKEAA